MSTAIDMKPPGGDEQEAGQPDGPVKQEIWAVAEHWRALQRLTADSERASYVLGPDNKDRFTSHALTASGLHNNEHNHQHGTTWKWWLGSRTTR